MSDLKISEAGSVQLPMVAHALATGRCGEPRAGESHGELSPAILAFPELLNIAEDEAVL